MSVITDDTKESDLEKGKFLSQEDLSRYYFCMDLALKEYLYYSKKIKNHLERVLEVEGA